MVSARRELVHGTCVALGPHGALLRGGSGSGKSDLALRFLALEAEQDLQPRLVADDQVWVEAKGDGSLVASAPPTIAGKIEVRGLGILDLPHRPNARLILVADLVSAEEVPRMPPDPRAANHPRRGCASSCKTCTFRAFRGAEAEIGASFGGVTIASSTGIGSGLRLTPVATKIAAFNRADQFCGAI